VNIMDRRKFGKKLLQTGIVAGGITSFGFNIDHRSNNQFQVQ